MKTKDKFFALLKEGFRLKTLRKMNESQLNILYKKVVKEDLSTNAERLQGITADITNNLKNANELVGEEDDEELKEKKSKKKKPSKKMKTPITTLGMFEDEIKEKFRSKAQQGFFFAKCEEEGPKSEWCEMAREFADDTEDFSKLPDKVESKEDKIRQIEESIVSLLKNYKKPTMTKKDLLEQGTETAPTKPKTKPGEKTKPRRTPYKPTTTPDPAPKATEKEAPVKTPTKTPSKPDRKTPYNPTPGPNPAPKANKEELKNKFIDMIVKVVNNG